MVVGGSMRLEAQLRPAFLRLTAFTIQAILIDTQQSTMETLGQIPKCHKPNSGEHEHTDVDD